MKKLSIKVIQVKQQSSAAGCGRNWDNLCGSRT